jgi:glycosyltransferase involved in cell wall biosynthesis
MKGKVGEALSRGLPVVATSIAAEGMGLEHNRDILIADEPEAFAEAIGSLLSSEEDWLRLAEGGRRHIEAHYSVVAVERTLGALLEETRLAATPGATGWPDGRTP